VNYSVGDIVHIHVPNHKGECLPLDTVGIIVEKKHASERTFDPDRRVRLLKYGVMSPAFSRVVFLTHMYLKPLSCKSEK